MNKQEFIERVKELTIFSKQILNVRLIDRDDVIKLIEQLDEPQKPVVPQFVADWIEYSKNTFLSLARSLMVENIDFYNYANQEDHSRLIEFLGSGINQEIFVRAWLDGFEIEKEKRYYIRLKNVDENYNYLTCIRLLNAWALTEIKRDKKFRTEHTKEQLEDAGFGEVFDSPLFEVEEVE